MRSGAAHGARDLDAFEFIERVQNLSTNVDVIAAMQADLGRFGVEYLCFNFLPKPDESFAEVLLANRLPVGWVDLYNEKQFVHVDPSIRHCKRMLRPFRWFKDAPYDPAKDPLAVEILQRALDFGMRDGLVFPIATLTNRMGHVWLGGQTLDLTSCQMSTLYIMAFCAFDRIHRLHIPPAKEKPCLTPREREALTWVARGKSAWEIGEILKLSQRTVEWHIENACRKLDAVNRTQASMIALRDRIIEP